MKAQRNFCSELSKEFKWELAKLKNTTKKDIETFGTCEHACHCCYGAGGFLVLWRGASALIWVVYTLWRFLTELEEFGVDGFSFLTKYTHWQLIMVAISFTFNFFTTYIRWKNSDQDIEEESSEQKFPMHVLCSWVLFNIAAVFSFVAFFAFWVLIGGGPDSFTTHGLPFVFMAVDISVTRMPYRLAHLWHAQALTIVYGIFTYIYTYTTGIAIYDFFDYPNEPWTIVMPWIILVTILPLGQIVFWTIWYYTRSSSLTGDRGNAPHIELDEKKKARGPEEEI
mmetsp:Transcript_24255/g.42970  ORF Transcript_24255/g.42970 Transcript_24255/m.42970 type:complete len:282 (-) Transcript_24255:327-1172(-)